MRSKMTGGGEQRFGEGRHRALDWPRLRPPSRRRTGKARDRAAYLHAHATDPADWRHSRWLTALTSSGGLDRDTVISTVEAPSLCRFLPTTKRVNLSVPEKSGFAK